jgi:hypothetical protein
MFDDVLIVTEITGRDPSSPCRRLSIFFFFRYRFLQPKRDIKGWWEWLTYFFNFGCRGPGFELVSQRGLFLHSCYPCVFHEHRRPTIVPARGLVSLQGIPESPVCFDMLALSFANGIPAAIKLEYTLTEGGNVAAPPRRCGAPAGGFSGAVGVRN